MVAAGPIRISALIMGPTPGAAPVVVLGLEIGMPSVLVEALEVCLAGMLLRCGTVDCCSWLLLPELLWPLVGADRLLPEHACC